MEWETCFLPLGIADWGLGLLSSELSSQSWPCTSPLSGRAVAAVEAVMQQSSMRTERPGAGRAAMEVVGLGPAAMVEARGSLEGKGRRPVEAAEMPDREKLPRGGRGGSAEIQGQVGTAIGGSGGRGGDVPGAKGGDGGNAIQIGPGVAIGGDGGDAGRLGRPTLGAPSVSERLLDSDRAHFLLATQVDCYGILMIGRGGDSGEATVVFEERSYSLNVLLKLLRIWQNEIIDIVDHLGPTSPQAWWETAYANFPNQCERAMAHMRKCEDYPAHSRPSPYRVICR